MAPAEATASARRRSLLIADGRRYWPRGAEIVETLAASTPARQADGEFRGFVEVALPEWAADLGIGTPPALLVDARAVGNGGGPAHARCDWWLAAHLMLASAAEREHEARHGPVHSYAWRLRIDPRAFTRAWVNRILLYLRRAAARQAGQDEAAVFGARPAGEIIVTFDLDAVRLRPELRLKQGAFHLLNAARHAARAEFAAAGRRLRAVGRIAAAPAGLGDFGALVAAPAKRGLATRLHVYGGESGRRRGWPGILMDPGYDCADPSLVATLKHLAAQGVEIGLHPSFGTWRSAERIAAERARLAAAVATDIQSCRQHWLRFSFRDTWAAQAAAGLTRDATLGFNDRPGFRNGAALAFAPADPVTLAPLRLTAEPMILMDSHVHDYDLDAARDPGRAMEPWIAEVKAVGGTATVLWHPHTLHAGYGWGAAFETLLDLVAARA